jgi:hypothetical protein
MLRHRHRHHHRHRYRRVGQLALAEGELQRPCPTSSTPPLQSLVSWLQWRSERHHPSHEKGRREMLLQLHDSCEAPCERPLPLALRATVAEHWVDAPMLGWWVWCWQRWSSSSTRGARQRVYQYRMDPKGWWRATRRALQHHLLPSHRHHHVHGACPQPLVGPPSFRVPSCRRVWCWPPHDSVRKGAQSRVGTRRWPAECCSRWCGHTTLCPSGRTDTLRVFKLVTRREAGRQQGQSGALFTPATNNSARHHTAIDGCATSRLTIQCVCRAAAVQRQCQI